MGLSSLFSEKRNTSTDTLHDASYISSVEHIVGPWHQYDFTLSTRGYDWNYILDSARYMTTADLMNIGTISVSPSMGGADIEYIDAYKANGGNIDLIDELKTEASMLGLGGISKALGGMPLKIVWINQTNVIRIMTPVDDEDFMIRYMETVIRRSFGTADALKKGNSPIRRISELH